MGSTWAGDIIDTPGLILLIRRVKPDARITYTDTPLAFPEGSDDHVLRQHARRVYHTPLAEGVQQTIGQFEERLADGRIAADAS